MRKFDVDEGGYRLDGAGVLGVVDEVPDAGLEFWVPLEDLILVLLEGLVSMRGDSLSVSFLDSYNTQSSFPLVANLVNGL